MSAGGGTGGKGQLGPTRRTKPSKRRAVQPNQSNKPHPRHRFLVACAECENGVVSVLMDLPPSMERAPADALSQFKCARCVRRRTNTAGPGPLADTTTNPSSDSDSDTPAPMTRNRLLLSPPSEQRASDGMGGMVDQPKRELDKHKVSATLPVPPVLGSRNEFAAASFHASTRTFLI
jgi:hypothetical protein